MLIVKHPYIVLVYAAMNVDVNVKQKKIWFCVIVKGVQSHKLFENNQDLQRKVILSRM